MPLTWTTEKPTTEGWYWVKRNESNCIVKLERVRALGSCLAAYFPTVRGWFKVDEIDREQWAGPIAEPTSMKHSENCDAVDRNPEGITKPCNCGA